jgi:hypothetical protein
VYEFEHFCGLFNAKLSKNMVHYFEAINRGWDEKFCLSKPRTTEGPRTREARTREGILYYAGKFYDVDKL